MDNEQTLPLIPTRGITVFPRSIVQLDVGRAKSVRAIEQAMLTNKKIMLISQKNPQVEQPDSSQDIYSVGVVAEIKQILKIPDGSLRVVVEGIRRAKIITIQDEDFLEATISAAEDSEVDLDKETVQKNNFLYRMLLKEFEKWGKIGKKLTPDALSGILLMPYSGILIDVIANTLPLNNADKQRVLDTVNITDRLCLVYEFVCRELEILEIEKTIAAQVRSQVNKTQKEYYLREQLKAINKELGESSERGSEIKDYREKLKEEDYPDNVREKITQEMERLERVPVSNPEGAIIRTYIDTLLALPWKKVTPEYLNLKKAEKVLNDDHFGLEKVKERILEYLAVKELTKKNNGSIICLVGPPGVGKTSLGKSIAAALERKFIRVSLGGVRDEAEIRGHRRTYVGAMPGRILQNLKTCGVKNPVFLLDEIDKMTSDFRGDPSSAMLEVLDPEQNSTFTDHYVELPFDLSEVFWLATANTTATIPRPLLDRMEVIHLSSYTDEEKFQIANKYLIPKQITKHGIKKDQLSFAKNVVYKIIRNYTREAGVRNLERSIAKVCRKISRKIVEHEAEKFSIKLNNLSTYLERELYSDSDNVLNNEIGVTTGLAWTSVGGDVLTIEVSTTKGKGSLLLTGQLGDVMKESAKAGLTYIREKAEELGIETDFFAEHDIHIHIPEGAIPKDGPSAGITMTLAIISALTKRRVVSSLAMTGEITLRGRVLAVGGIKEKVLAANRYGVTTILLPEKNMVDIEDLPLGVKKNIKFIAIKHMDEVLSIALEGK